MSSHEVSKYHKVTKGVTWLRAQANGYLFFLINKFTSSRIFSHLTAFLLRKYDII